MTTAAALVHELMEARDERRLLNLQRQLSRLNLLVIDSPVVRFAAALDTGWMLDVVVANVVELVVVLADTITFRSHPDDVSGKSGCLARVGLRRHWPLAQAPPDFGSSDEDVPVFIRRCCYDGAVVHWSEMKHELWSRTK